MFSIFLSPFFSAAGDGDPLGLLAHAPLPAAHGCINVHASILPRWRGASPIQAAIAAGDERTGVSMMRMDAGMDTRAVYGARSGEFPEMVRETGT